MTQKPQIQIRRLKYPSWTDIYSKLDGITVATHPRLIEEKVQEALKDTRVVMITGPRQAGKTTLVRMLSSAIRDYVTLDDPVSYEAAKTDPIGLTRDLDYVAIDEVQRAPELLPVIKMSVDRDERPGRFLLSGSANILFSEGRLGASRKLYPYKDTIKRVLDGGYPEIQSRNSAARRQAWARAFIETILSRDVQEITESDKLNDLNPLLQAAAIQSGQLLAHSPIANRQASETRCENRSTVLEGVGTDALHTRFASLASQCAETAGEIAKAAFSRHRPLGAIRNLTEDKLEAERELYGAVFEIFVSTELTKQASWSDDHMTFSHYRDKDQAEVDSVIERSGGEIVDVEVKASAAVKSDDFTGLRMLMGASKGAFRRGVVLYSGEKITPFGE